MPRVLGIYVKHPQPGQVKTRLAAELGPEAAANLYQAFLKDLTARFRQTADRRFLCFSPDTAEAEEWFQDLAGSDYELWPQPDGSLAPRLSNFFEFTANGAEGTVVIGSDSPTLPIEWIEQAFEHLQSRDCVLGPATDGGYYLVGLQKPLPIFTDIAWSTANVLSQTVDRISRISATLGLLSPWYDVDTPDDLKLLRGHLRALMHSQEDLGHALSQTRKALKL